jgi:hypothetical protein
MTARIKSYPSMETRPSPPDHYYTEYSLSDIMALDKYWPDMNNIAGGSPREPVRMADHESIRLSETLLLDCRRWRICVDGLGLGIYQRWFFTARIRRGSFDLVDRHVRRSFRFDKVAAAVGRRNSEKTNRQWRSGRSGRSRSVRQEHSQHEETHRSVRSSTRIRTAVDPG